MKKIIITIGLIATLLLVSGCSQSAGDLELNETHLTTIHVSGWLGVKKTGLNVVVGGLNHYFVDNKTTDSNGEVAFMLDSKYCYNVDIWDSEGIAHCYKIVPTKSEYYINIGTT